MTKAAPFAEIWRGPILESVHSGHAVICDASGQIVEAWGDPEKVILPRSSSKMIQALPLINSGAADKAGLSTEQLALACASHQGAAIHTDRVGVWLDTLGLSDDDFRCGAQEPNDRDAMEGLIRAHEKPCQIHNNCSGKHAGFLTLNKHLGGGRITKSPITRCKKPALKRLKRSPKKPRPAMASTAVRPPTRPAPCTAWPARWRILPPPPKALLRRACTKPCAYTLNSSPAKAVPARN